MKLKYCVITIIIVMLSTPALAAYGKTFGIGVIAGEPTGITGK